MSFNPTYKGGLIQIQDGSQGGDVCINTDEGGGLIIEKDSPRTTMKQITDKLDLMDKRSDLQDLDLLDIRSDLSKLRREMLLYRAKQLRNQPTSTKPNWFRTISIILLIILIPIAAYFHTLMFFQI